MISGLHGLMYPNRARIASDVFLDLNPANGVTYDGSNKVTAINLGNGYALGQANAAKQFNYNATGWDGGPCVTLDGIDDAMTVAFSLGITEITIKIVARTTKAPGTHQTLFEKTSSFGTRYLNEYNTYIATASNPWNSVAGIVGSIAANTKYLSSSRYRSGELRTSHNQAVAPSKSTITGPIDASASSLSIGAGASGTANYFQGDIARILVWMRYLSDQESQDTNRALKQIYGLTF